VYRLLAVAVLATALSGCGSQSSQLPNHVAPGPGVVDDELTFTPPVEATKIFEWARKYDIEAVEFVRAFPVDEGGGINWNFDGAGMSEEELAAEWRLEMSDLTGLPEDVWWRRGGPGRYASRTFLSLVETVFLRGTARALAQAKAHPPSAP
jgi:hypothetical protein